MREFLHDFGIIILPGKLDEDPVSSPLFFLHGDIEGEIYHVFAHMAKYWWNRETQSLKIRN